MKKVAHLVFLALLLFEGTSEGNDATYKGLRRVDPGECRTADASVMSSLPAHWQKYSGFVKRCALAKNGRAAVSIISVWVEDYLEDKYRPPAVPRWENFPLPVIADKRMRAIGSLPEIFPVGDGVFLTVSYGKWKGDIPTEITVDVENPAEGGDYYYDPILYNSPTGKYELWNKEVTHGSR